MEELIHQGERIANVYQAGSFRGISGCREDASRELRVSATSRHVVTLDADALLDGVDGRYALGRLSLAGLTGARSMTSRLRLGAIAERDQGFVPELNTYSGVAIALKEILYSSLKHRDHRGAKSHQRTLTLLTIVDRRCPTALGRP